MLAELKTALAAAEAYEVKNEGDGPHVNLIHAFLADAIAHAEKLDEFALGHENALNLRTAEEALRVAQAAQAAPAPVAPQAPQPAVETAP